MRILVVDDEPEIASLFRDYLELQGYEVSLAASGQEALEQVRLHRPDLVILDIVMPGLSGFQVLDALKRNPATAEIPVILVSTTDGPALGERDALGLIDFLRKPIDFGRLRALIAGVERDRSGKRLRVLVVEDIEEEAGLIRHALEGMGHKVEVAADGESGLSKARQFLPDLVIADYFLPIRDGVELSKELKRSPLTAHIPVILVSAYIPPKAEGEIHVFYRPSDAVRRLCGQIAEIFPAQAAPSAEPSFAALGAR